MDQLTRLLLDAQHGDRDALERFVRATQHDVIALCRHLGDPDSADDLAQEAYQRAIASLHRYRATGPAKHWLLTIARRTCADATRRRSRRRRLHQRVTSLAHDDLVAAPRTARPEIDELLAELDDDRRAAFVLTQLNGLRYEDAAAVLGVPIGTIRSRVARAREQLLDVLDAHERAFAEHDERQAEHDHPDREPQRRPRRPHAR
jgi:RNA polymerase sigma-70 factor (ECF subfamily)